jgi:hypothetical protein
LEALNLSGKRGLFIEIGTPSSGGSGGVPGLSCLKHADATDRGLINKPKLIRPPKLDNKGASKNYSQGPT